jgi:molybdopterin synthase catalytic subunit
MLPERCCVKVIPVTGLSGSGKTTFIRALIPILARFGPVGTVKHTGHHSMLLPKGKDTTVMFEAGARAVAGIDQEKTLISIQGTSLIDALDFLSKQGISIAVMEGYKGSSLPKIVIGDLEAEACVLRDPHPEDVVHALDRFPDYITQGEILRDLGESCRRRERPCATAASTMPVPAGTGGDLLPSLERALPDIARRMEGLPRVLGARAAIRHGALFGGNDEILIAVAAGSGEGAGTALQSALSWCREILKDRGATLQ